MRLSSLTTLSATFLLSGLVTVPTQAQTIDPNSAKGYVALNRKIQCSTEDSSPQVFEWSGYGYSRVPGEPDRRIFGLLGMNVRQCGQVEDPEKGTGYRLVSREIMLYLDPKTGEVLRTFDNPWTGEANEVIHVANDPVNGRPSFGVNADGSEKAFTYRDINGQYLINFEIPLFYKNAMGGEYQKYVGGSYHATEIFDFNGDVAELLDASQPVAYPVISWVRLAQWLPWMEMSGRAGMLYFNAMGRKLLNYDQLSDLLKSEIAANYPEYVAPPPLDDPRRNETSWTYMKRIIDGRESEESSHSNH
jgi:hypothetical protein